MESGQQKAPWMNGRRRLSATVHTWGLRKCRVSGVIGTCIHRHGRLLPGAPIVLVTTAAPHRADAFAAAQFLMDWLKTSAPFWKREEWADGTARWVEAKGSDDAAAERWLAG